MSTVLETSTVDDKVLKIKEKKKRERIMLKK
jgi:hypothetical protein